MMGSICSKKSIEGMIEIIQSPFLDERGVFINLFRSKDNLFSSTWEGRAIKQINFSKTSKKGTIRGLHYQCEPFPEAKLISCLKGKVFDVVVDLRKQSKTYGKWDAVELCAEKSNSILIPEGCAHGFQVLIDNSELLYIHSANWVKDAERGLNWNDQTIKINWPLPPKGISNKDKNLPFLHF
tara:strand:- start:509 stop:1054 length:546 start_codon:yes stop_codon:yes gene_type:complete